MAKDLIVRGTHIYLHELMRRYKSSSSAKLFFVEDGIKPMWWKKVGLFEVNTEIIYPIDCDVIDSLSGLMSYEEILKLPDADGSKEIVGGNYFIIKNDKIDYIGKSSNVYKRAFDQLSYLKGDSVKILVNNDYHALESKYTYILLDDIKKFHATDHSWLRDIIRSRIIIEVTKNDDDDICFTTMYILGKDPVVAKKISDRKVIRRSELHLHNKP